MEAWERFHKVECQQVRKASWVLSWGIISQFIKYGHLFAFLDADYLVAQVTNIYCSSGPDSIKKISSLNGHQCLILLTIYYQSCTDKDIVYIVTLQL